MSKKHHPSPSDEAESEYHVDGFAFLGRPLVEYRRFFDFDFDALSGKRVLDCPSGPSSFVAEASERGIEAVGADIAHDESPRRLDERGRASIREARTSIRDALDLFTIETDEQIERHCERRAAAHGRFLVDYATNGERYVHAELPSLPFPDDSFDLVLSAHLCFLYGDRLDRAFHVETLRELARVAAHEVRVYPLVDLQGEPSPYVDGVVDRLEREGHVAEVVEVPYEFLRGATEMLRVSPSA